MTDSKSKIYTVLPLRDIVVFPNMAITLFVGRSKSIAAISHASDHHENLLLVTQEDEAIDDPTSEQLYTVGTEGKINQIITLPDGTIKILVEGVRRHKIDHFTDTGNFIQAQASPITFKVSSQEIHEILRESLLDSFQEYAKYHKRLPNDLGRSLGRIKDLEKICDSIAAQLNISNKERQEILETNECSERVEKIIGALSKELEALKIEERIRKRVKSQMEKNQREYYLQEQMKAIHSELHGNEEGKDEFSLLQKRIEKKKLSKEAREKALAELKKLRMMSPMASENVIIRNYLDCLLDLPWQEFSVLKKELKYAEKILNHDHYGLQKVKERILEHLAVQQRLKKPKGQVLCFVGPPGVGKTSLARSIARATGREFVKVSLGGVHDESEIRGHRRTYVGALPGRIIQSMKKAKKANPLILLDEIDKVGTDWRGDPSAALLEVLDPEQNAYFSDHYLEVDYDLSNVMFITTANSLNILRPLLDRMEVIHLSGYTEQEKYEIARRHLIPKQIKQNGLQKKEISFSKEALYQIIHFYTREAGVRNLERAIAMAARKVLKYILSTKKVAMKITRTNVEKVLGVPKFRKTKAESEPLLGAATGLAWTEVGGDLLTIEAAISKGKGKAVFTGKLGEVMQESMHTAISYVRSQARTLGIFAEHFLEHDIHLHVPEGATPKDGPSAGIAIITAVVSLLTGIKVRPDVAMTGEVTLRGKVLAIGGLKEKLLAAQRAGIKKVLIPEDNAQDLKELPRNITENLEIICVQSVSEVLEQALLSIPQKIEASEAYERLLQSKPPLYKENPIHT